MQRTSYHDGRSLLEDLAAGGYRPIKPVAALTRCILPAEIMNHAGTDRGVGPGGPQAIRRFRFDDLALTLTAAAGAAVSGYVMGSNVAGNALLMGSAHAFGADAGTGVLFTAVPDSATGHTVFASGPIVVMVGGLAHATRCCNKRVVFASPFG